MLGLHMSAVGNFTMVSSGMAVLDYLPYADYTSELDNMPNVVAHVG
jgi:hypothetical protein